MTAALLSAGSAVMPVNAASEITAYSTVNKDKVLANGVKFYLQKSTEAKAGETYYTVKEVTLKDKTKVWTLTEAESIPNPITAMFAALTVKLPLMMTMSGNAPHAITRITPR